MALNGPLQSNIIASMFGGLGGQAAQGQQEGSDALAVLSTLVAQNTGGNRSITEGIIEGGVSKVLEAGGGDLSIEAMQQAVAAINNGPSARDIANSSNMSLKDVAESEAVRLQNIMMQAEQDLAEYNEAIEIFDTLLALSQKGPLTNPDDFQALVKNYQDMQRVLGFQMDQGLYQRIANGTLTDTDRQYLNYLQGHRNDLVAERDEISKLYEAEKYEAAIRHEEASQALARVKADMKQRTAELYKSFQEQSNGSSYEAKRAEKRQKEIKQKKKEAEAAYYEALGYGAV